MFEFLFCDCNLCFEKREKFYDYLVLFAGVCGVGVMFGFFWSWQ